jgi:hypothetical protein
MRVRRMLTAAHLFPSDTPRQDQIPVGTAGLRHKPRHNLGIVRFGIGPLAGAPSGAFIFRQKICNQGCSFAPLEIFAAHEHSGLPQADQSPLRNSAEGSNYREGSGLGIRQCRYLHSGAGTPARRPRMTLSPFVQIVWGACDIAAVPRPNCPV